LVTVERAVRALLVGKRRMRFVLVAFAKPYLKQLVESIERLRLLERRFTQEGIHHTIKSFDFPRGFRRVRLGKEKTDSELRAGPRHPLRAVLLPVVEVDGLRYTVFLYGSAEAVLDDGLIHHRIKLAVEHIPRRIVDERHKKHLFHRAARSDRQVRTIFQVGVPQTISMLLLEAPRSYAGFRIHPHMAGTVAALCKLLLQRAPLNLPRTDAA